MDIEVYKRIKGFEYESFAIFDTWKSLIVDWEYRTYSKFSMQVPIIETNVDMFIPETILVIKDVPFYVDDVYCDDVSQGVLTVAGKSLDAKLEDRIIWTTYSANKKAEDICSELIKREVISPADSKRKMSYLTIKPNASLTQSNIVYQNSYGNLLEEVSTLCNTYDFGIRTTVKDGYKSEIEVYKGKDVSELVEFSVQYDNLIGESYENNTYDEKTTALVMGEGEGKDRKSVTIANNLVGIERKELYVDARDLRSDDENLRASNYDKALESRGNEKISEQNSVLTLNGIIDINNSLFEYGKDYSLGDKVKISSRLFNLESKVILEGIRETYDDKGFYIEPNFGDSTVNILDLIRRK